RSLDFQLQAPKQPRFAVGVNVRFILIFLPGCTCPASAGLSFLAGGTSCRASNCRCRTVALVAGDSASQPHPSRDWGYFLRGSGVAVSPWRVVGGSVFWGATSRSQWQIKKKPRDRPAVGPCPKADLQRRPPVGPKVTQLERPLSACVFTFMN